MYIHLSLCTRCILFSSLIKVMLTAVVDMAKYRNMYSPSLDGLKSRGLLR